ncbi:MAG: transglycosylase SLT domain-containing protein [Candidatus Binatia bacterium]
MRSGQARQPKSRGRIASGLLALSLCVGLSTRADAENFPKPPGIVTQVEFWKKIFAEYSEHQVVIHDNLYLDKIYTVIDLRPLAASGVDEETLRRTRHAKQKQELAAIDAALAKLAKGGMSVENLEDREREIWELFQDVPSNRRFTQARERVRSQQGLKERFRRGLAISRRYLPHMEQIFRREGLPIELTRLPFIESSFNIRAYSKAAAAGIWQFIPSSARIYLRLNAIEDSRRDPLYATMGAAAHLRDDYEALGVWPLAITAYNHGRGGMAGAVAKLGTTDIAEIIRRYDGRSFGFASRNFYPEFIAALEVERDYKRYFGEIEFEPPLEFQHVRTRDYVRFSTAARLAGMSVEGLRELNPGYSTAVVDGKLYVPKGYELRVPAGRGDDFRVAYASLPGSERFSRQRSQYLTHRVKRGQTLGAIAKRYRTSVSAIQVANQLRNARRLRAGQVLKIPTG